MQTKISSFSSKSTQGFAIDCLIARLVAWRRLVLQLHFKFIKYLTTMINKMGVGVCPTSAPSIKNQMQIFAKKKPKASIKSNSSLYGSRINYAENDSLVQENNQTFSVEDEETHNDSEDSVDSVEVFEKKRYSFAHWKIHIIRCLMNFREHRKASNRRNCPSSQSKTPISPPLKWIETESKRLLVENCTRKLTILSGKTP